jgi:hypothetical protein
MSASLAPPAPDLAPRRSIARPAECDAPLLALWLLGRSPHTRRASRREAARFLAHAGRPLREVTLGDVRALAPAGPAPPAAGSAANAHDARRRETRRGHGE